MQNGLEKIEITFNETEVKDVAGKQIQLLKIASNEQNADEYPVNVILKKPGSVSSWFNHADVGPYSPSLFDAYLWDKQPFTVPVDGVLYLKLGTNDQNAKPATATIFYKLA